MSRGIRRIQPGDRIRAGWLNKVADGAELALERLHPPRQIDEDGDLPEPTDQSTPSVNPERALILDATSNVNYWVCLRLSDGSLIDVAKPDILRGFGLTRTVSGEAQVVLPLVEEAESVIYFFDTENASGSHNTGVTDVRYQDMNVDARMWAEDT